MQLVAYGAQDIYLTGNPQITFFKVVYRRHTNFSMECISQTFDGTVGTGESSVSATIARNGDLIHSMHLDSVLSGVTQASAGTYSQFTNNTGHAYLKEVELEIGGQRIDKHYGHWLDVWSELTDHEESEYIGLNKHKAKTSYLRSGGSGNTNPTHSTWQLFIPLKFWFCRNPGLALPLIALQYHEVKVKCVFRALAALVNTDDASAASTVAFASAPTTTLWVDYIYLDTDERRRFAQQSHEYLIEQLQFEQNTASGSTTLNLNHPVKELIWNIQQPEAVAEVTAVTGARNALANTAGGTHAAGNDYFNYEGSSSTGSNWSTGGVQSSHSFDKVKLQLNGHDRFTERKAVYFNQVTPRQAGHRVPEKHIYVYSFALKPEEHQPSGTCNFSRIDNAKLVFTGNSPNADNVNVYAVNYNVLRVMSGMGGLAYSN